jgi:predicted MFS family arabinose efflux permease
MGMAVTHRPGSARDPDGKAAIVAAIVIGTVSPSILTMMPVVVQAFVDKAGLSEAQSGFVASIEVLGILISTIGFTAIQRRVRWSRAAMAGLALFAASNMASTLFTGFPLLASIRFSAGIGAGMAIAISFGALALTRHPDRWFGWLVASVLTYAGLGLWFVPVIYKLGGLTALMASFTGIGLAALAVAAFVTDGRTTEATPAKAMAPPTLKLHVSALLTLFLFFLGYALLWTYMNLIGADSALTEEKISIALTGSQAFGVLGAIMIAIAAEPIERRFGRRNTLGVLIFIGASGTAAFVLHQSFVLFCILNAVFQFTWNAGQPALLGAVAAADSSGRLVTTAVPMQFLGYTIGPALAALLVKHGHAPLVWVSAALIVISFAALQPLTARR